MNVATKIELDRVELISTIGREFPSGRGVEVGTFEGEFSKKIVEAWPGTLYMVDVWRPLDDHEYQDFSNHSTHGDVYKRAMGNVSGYEDRALMIRSSSESAASIFEDGSLDFVYIDANHAYDYVVKDIELWYPKVRSGGFLCGHDYIDIDWSEDPNFLENRKDKHIYTDVYLGIFGVNPAVDEFCKRNQYDLSVTNEWFGSWCFRKR